MDNLTHENKLRVTVHSEVRKICREVGEQINMEVDADGVSLIAEFLWKRLRVIAQDLEQFARHAKRSTINAEDVKLLVRRNTHLKEKVSEMAESAAKKKRQMKDKDKEQEDTSSSNNFQ